MRRIAKNIERYIPGTQVTPNWMRNTSFCNRLLVQQRDARIKIEVTPVLRGSLHPPVIFTVSPSVEDGFGAAQMRLLDFNELIRRQNMCSS